MAQLAPYVRFNDGKCREAFNFYKECLGGELTIMTVGESPMGKDMPAERKDFIMHVTLKNKNLELSGSDMMRDKAVIGDNVIMSVNCDSEDEIKTLAEKLSAGGEVFMPVEKQFWGALFGVVTDKYGVEWMLNFNLK